VLRLAPALAARFFELDARELGGAGEELAARWLARRGWRILGRRLPTPAGEVDILARCPASGARVCLEVKTARPPALPLRRGARQAALHPLTRPARRLARAQAARLERAARALGASRVDLVEVVLARRARARVLHAPGAVQARPPYGR
jgi:putative endonuclease